MNLEISVNGNVDVEAPKRTTSESNSPALFRKALRPLTLKFEDVVYKVKVEQGRWMTLMRRPSSKSHDRVILKGVAGIVRPGEMLALLGPSGSGKTTLLTALGGRLGGDLKGTITYNGKPYSNKTKRCTGFVTQDDVLYAHLTVTETLVYTALLRLPNTLTKQDKIEQAEAVLIQLGLTRCRNSVIGGSDLLRGISGGERKRVSIGQEMLVDPSLLFLDEPTSGLDSTTAQRIVSTLSDLAHGGRTIVMTIHQPSSRLFYMFNKVLLLSEGNPLYFGSGAQAMDYFQTLGFTPFVSMNPADFLLDLANGVSPDDSEDPAAVKEKLILAYKNNLANKVQEEMQEEDDVGDTGDRCEPSRRKWATTWWQQFSVLLSRGLKERKHETVNVFKITEVVVVAFIAGLFWWQSPISRLQDQIGLLYFSSGFWGFFPLFDAIFTFPAERMILAKERSSGMYRLSSYFMARTLSDLPIVVILPTVFITITYWMAGLKHTVTSFFSYLFSLLLSVLVAQGLGLALGALIMDLKQATTMGSVLMHTILIAGGYFVQHVPDFISWMKYLSFSNYSYRLMIWSQYKPGDTYPCEGHEKLCLVQDFPSIKSVGLKGQHFSLIGLFLMFVAYRLIAYVALMRVGVVKKVKT